MPTGEAIDVFFKYLGYLAPLVGGLAVWAITKYWKLLHSEREGVALRKEKEILEAKLADARAERSELQVKFDERYDHQRAKYHEAYDKFQRLKSLYLTTKAKLDGRPSPDRVDELLGKVAARTAELESAIAEVRQGAATHEAQARELVASRELIGHLGQQIADRDAEIATVRQDSEELQRRFAAAAKFDGRLWLREPVGPVPPFRPRTERDSVIISVLNLKGGVGKTTIAANLAATLARPDGKTLLVDLDYQRSLSMLLVADKDRGLLHRGGSSVQHFLAADAHPLADLTRRTVQLDPDVANCSLLANSDSGDEDRADGLEETETRLMAEWLFDPTRPDPRFFLRDALHSKENPYRYVLLDCPPRLTTACVAALAASDFVLIPIVPDALSTRAVENLLRTLKRFRENLLPELFILGIVPNMVRVRNSAPISDHAAALGELRDLLPVWDNTAKITKAMIKHDTQFVESAAALDVGGKPKLAISNPDVRAGFEALARELEKEIDRHARDRSATVPAKPGPRARGRR